MIDRTDPTNRDTVPAMLTPGEFVLNKEATNMFAPVIEQMNNAGLQHRAMKNMGGGVPPQGYNTGNEVQGYNIGNPVKGNNIQGMKSFLDFIGSGEGGYEASNRGTVDKKIVGSTRNTVYKGKKLSEMTVNEILAAQASTGDDKLFAVGKYQMIPSTFKEVVEGMGLSGDTVFSNDFQDQAGMYLATQKRPILGAYLNGENWEGKPVTEDTALMELAKEWASAPLPYDVQIGDTLRKAGESRYGSGNKAQHSVQEARDAIRSAKISMTGEYPEVPQNYAEYSPERFAYEAQTVNNPGAEYKTFVDASNTVDQSNPNISGVIPEVIQTTFLPNLPSEQPVPNQYRSVPTEPNQYRSVPTEPNQYRSVPNLTQAPPEPEQSFSQAFASGRAAHGGGGGVFNYNGKQYSTNIAEEEQNRMMAGDSTMTANMGGYALNLNVGGGPVGFPDDEDLLANSSQSQVEKFLNNQVKNQERGIPGGSVPRPSIQDDAGNIRQGTSRATMIGGEPFFMYDDGVVTDRNNESVMTDGIIKMVHDKLTFNPQEQALDSALQLESQGVRDQMNQIPNIGSGVNPSYNEMTEDQDNAIMNAQLSEEDARKEAERLRNNAEVEARSQIAPPQLDPNAPTFNEAVLPYLGRVGSSLAGNVYNTIDDFAASGVLPVGTVDVNEEYRKLTQQVSSGELSPNQIIAANIRIAQIERQVDYDRRMEPYSLQSIADKMLNVENKIINAGSNAVYNAAGNLVSNFNPETGASILDNQKDFVPKPERELSESEIEFNTLRENKGKKVKQVKTSLVRPSALDIIEKIELEEEKARANEVVPDNTGNTTQTAAVTTDLSSDDTNAAGKAVANADNNSFKEAKNILMGVFGELFSAKELTRAAIMYLGARATGLNGNQSLAFAGKQYITRTDANEKTFLTVATSGDWEPESVKLYKKSMDPTVLIPLGAAPVPTGATKTFFSKSTGAEYFAVAKKVGDATHYFVGNKQLDMTKVTENGTFSPFSPEGKAFKATLMDSASTVIKELHTQNMSPKMEGDSGPAKPILRGLSPEVASKGAAAWAMKNQVPLELMPRIISMAYDEALVDTSSGKTVKNLDAYYDRAWVVKETANVSAFSMPQSAKDKKNNVPPKLASVGSINSFLSAIRNQALIVSRSNNELDALGGATVAAKNNTELSSWLMQTKEYKKWTDGSLSQEDKQQYINRGVELGNSGMMQFVLEGFSPKT